MSGSIFLRISWPETRAFSQAQRFASWLQRLLRKSHEKYFQSKENNVEKHQWGGNEY